LHEAFIVAAEEGLKDFD